MVALTDELETLDFNKFYNFRNFENREKRIMRSSIANYLDKLDKNPTKQEFKESKSDRISCGLTYVGLIGYMGALVYGTYLGLRELTDFLF